VFVYVVKPDSTVTIRPITEGVTEGENTEITSGLAAGEVVVLMGVDKLEEGTPVRAEIQGEDGGAQRGNTKHKKTAGRGAAGAQR
jgi:multidrug efflux system membrane fusion protein